jgi:hypothetical protein
MQVRLIVPNCNRSTSPVVAYGPRIANIAGGFTAVQGTGGWIDKNGVLVVEPVTVFDCDIPRSDGSGRAPALRNLAEMIKADLRQDCVYLRIDDIVKYI